MHSLCYIWCAYQYNFLLLYTPILVVLSLVQIDMNQSEIFAISGSQNARKLNHRELYPVYSQLKI